VFKYYGIGSIIQSLPSVRRIKDVYPNSQVHYVTNKSNKELFNKIDFIDNIIAISDKNIIHFLIDLSKSILFLWLKKIDMFFDLEIYSSFSTLFSTISLARNRYGFYRQFSFYKTGLYTHLLYFNSSKHISKIYNMLFNLAGVTTSDFVNFNIFNGYQKSKISALRLDENKYIVINPNASDLFPNRRLPANYWKIIIGYINKYCEYPVCIVGSKSETKYVELIIGSINTTSQGKIINLTGKTTLCELVDIIAYAKVVITVDSGVMHIAFATNTTSLSLFGPGNPKHYGPIDREKHKVIYKNVYCSPCIYEVDNPPCKNNNLCMSTIYPKEIIENLKNMVPDLLFGDPKELEWENTDEIKNYIYGNLII